MKNLIIITLDTFRKDRLTRQITPNLWAFSKACDNFPNVFTTCPITLPAHVSLFAGYYPNRTGVHKNGCHFYDGRYPTLAEVLQDKNYYTHAIISSIVLEKQFGLDRGFTIYDDDFGGKKRGKKWFGKRFWTRRAKETTNLALEAMKKHKKGSFFYWIHYFDCHSPYHKNNYNRECKYMDLHIGNLLSAIDLKNTIVIIVADHGEGLGEHGEIHHGTKLYNTTTRIPLLIYPKINVNESLNYSIIDILPTIFDLLELKQRCPLCDGVSLLSKYGRSCDRHLFMETLREDHLYACIFVDTKYVSDGKIYLLKDDILAVSGLDYKYVVSERQGQIDEYIEDSCPDSNVGDIEPEVKEQLKHLGYM